MLYFDVVVVGGSVNGLELGGFCFCGMLCFVDVVVDGVVVEMYCRKCLKVKNDGKKLLLFVLFSSIDQICI